MKSKPCNLMISNLHHIGKRENQQDSFAISNLEDQTLIQTKGVLAIVADGMGGLEDGANISAIVTATCIRYFQTQFEPCNIPQQLLLMTQAANQEARAFITANGDKQSGSTMIAVHMKDDVCHFVSVGDSRIALLRNKALIQLNREHTYASELDEMAARGEITVEEAMNDPQRKSLTSHIGMDEIAHIDYNFEPVKLLSNDRMILMSDGIFNSVSEAELIEAASVEDIYEAAQALEQAVLKKNKKHQDNFTAVLIHIT